MKDKYIPGQDCECHAYSESECGCDADWTPTEVYELREKLKSERALADRLAEALSVFDYRSADYMHSTSTDADRAIAALAAWKEARSE